MNEKRNVDFGRKRLTEVPRKSVGGLDIRLQWKNNFGRDFCVDFPVRWGYSKCVDNYYMSKSPERGSDCYVVICSVYVGDGTILNGKRPPSSYYYFIHKQLTLFIGSVIRRCFNRFCKLKRFFK